MPLWTRLAGWLLGLDLNRIVDAVTATLSARIKAQADTANIATQADLQMQLRQWEAQVENWRFQRDFAAEWSESLRVKHKAPLGEDELVRLAREHRKTRAAKRAD